MRQCIVALGLCVLGLAACGGDADSGDSTPNGVLPSGTDAGRNTPTPPTAGASGTSGGTDSGTTVGGPSTDASLDATIAPPDAGSDAAVTGMGQPVDPCGQDPASDAGWVRPSFASTDDGGAFAGDPSAMGLFDVLRVDASVPNPDPMRAALAVTFYAPSNPGAKEAIVGPLPLVLVMHGFGTTHTFYEHFSNHLASHGLLAVGLTLPGSFVAAHDKNADEAIAVIDYALGEDAPSGVRGRADPSRIAASGHSMGGKIAFYAAALDPRIDLVIGWDPSNAGGPPCFIDPNACNDFPVAPNCMAMDAGLLAGLRSESLVFRAAPDGANPEPDHNAIHFFRGAPAPATLVDYDTAAKHGDWASAASVPIDHTRRVQLAFLLSRFSGATGLEEWLPSGSKLATGTGVKRVLHKPSP